MDKKLYHDILSIDSTSGSERALAEMLAERLATPSCGLTRYEVGDGTLNLLFSWGVPRIVYCTHIDTVPPYIAPSYCGDEARGRGVCDAKGQIVAMHQACRELERLGYSHFALLLLSGEETGSWGAKHFARVYGGVVDYLVVGEPTDNAMASAAKGTKSYEVTFAGRSCHSGYPEYGCSAIDHFNAFYDWLRAVRLPVDPLLGSTTWNVGQLHSDNPQNILSPKLTFRLYFRTTEASDEMVARLMDGLHDGGDEPWRQAVSVKAFGGDTPTRYLTIPTIPSKPVAFGSDAPHLSCFRHKMICGPGSILTAHTADERVLMSDIDRATGQYVEIYRTLVLPALEREG